uniref:Uncharacterized protein n=1 Tax=Arundo donax TaxID=35708 RepID=A0A0A9CDF5_ARUDO
MVLVEPVKLMIYVDWLAMAAPITRLRASMPRRPEQSYLHPQPPRARTMIRRLETRKMEAAAAAKGHGSPRCELQPLCSAME